MDSLNDWATRSFAELSQVSIGHSEGPDHGPPLLLIHGLTDRRESFAPVAAELIKNFHGFAIDLRGHGESGHPDTGYTYTNYSDDVAEFIERVIGQSTLIWGHSLGAGTAIVTAHRHPELVSAVVAEDPGILRTSHGIPDDSAMLEILPQWAEFMRLQSTVSELEQLISTNELVAEMGAEAVRYFAECLTQIDVRTIDTALRGELISVHHPMDSLLKVQCPVFLMQADPGMGGVIPDDYLEGLRPMPATWTHKRYPGLGHNIHASDPATVARDVIEFLESAGSQRSSA